MLIAILVLLSVQTVCLVGLLLHALGLMGVIEYHDHDPVTYGFRPIPDDLDMEP